MSPTPPRTFIREHTHDAIVVVPGIMGSALCDAERGPIWGFGSPGPYLKLWFSPGQMAALGLSPAELAAVAEGRYDFASARVRPTGLIRFPSCAPFLGGFEPYTALAKALRAVAADPAAVLEFAYDWRLPVRLNARLLARSMREHLAAWRTHPACVAAREAHPERRQAQILIVAHSMGGLVARGLADPAIDDGFADVRKVITLGTPFYGSVKAAVILNTGDGTPIPMPKRQLRDAARTMPGVYDLLPRNRCLLDGADVVAPTAAHVEALGADRGLAEASLADFHALEATRLPHHQALLGVAQPTLQSFGISGGRVEVADYSYRFDGDTLLRDAQNRPLPFSDTGDGTVWRYAARPIGQDVPTTPFAQQHGALANANEMIRTVVGIVTDQEDLGIALGEGEIGLEVPDLVQPGEEFTITVTGEEDPAAVTCVVEDIGEAEVVRRPGLRWSNGTLAETVTLAAPGLYRIGVKAGAADPVTQVVLVAAPEP